MPASDDRFARQNRCGPPPGFPLASPCAGIVHRLSGPNGRAPARVPRRASGPAGGAPLSRVPTCVRLRCASGLLARPYTRGDVRLLGPCFKTGRRRPSSQRPGRRGAGASAAARSSARGARAAESGVCKSPPAAGGTTFPRPSCPGAGRRWPGRRGLRRAAPTTGARRAAPRRPSSGRGRFPPGNFTCCLTLFPGCFSSFDHSTCALSVSGRYLALEGIYLPLWAALPSYPTRRGTRPPAAVRTRGARPHGALTLCGAPFQGTRPARLEGPGARGAGGSLSRLQLGPPPRGGGPDFKSGLLPLRSPLLGQSRLVSFPPLTDMLKFGG